MLASAYAKLPDVDDTVERRVSGRRTKVKQQSLAAHVKYMRHFSADGPGGLNISNHDLRMSTFRYHRLQYVARSTRPHAKSHTTSTYNSNVSDSRPDCERRSVAPRATSEASCMPNIVVSPIQRMPPSGNRTMRVMEMHVKVARNVLTLQHLVSKAGMIGARLSDCILFIRLTDDCFSLVIAHARR